MLIVVMLSVPKLHDSIKILMKRYSILTRIGIPAAQNESMDPVVVAFARQFLSLS
jgi:hypothetical protein